MESVFAAIAGWLVLKEALTAKELAGCIIMFIAIIISQVSESISMQNGRIRS
jgi:drug/metabolite transporter (DMT)-like permease